MRIYRPDDEDDEDDGIALPRSGAVNPPTGLERWIEEFPLSSVRRNKWFYLRAEGHQISSPCTLAIREQMIEEVVGSRPKLPYVETDVFLFAFGESPLPHATKFGGIPYRRADQAWPMAKSGAAMAFVAQFCFSESKELVGDLPGEVMLVFFAEPDGLECHVEWQPLGLSNPATEAVEVDWFQLRCYGERHRVREFPKAKDVFSGPRRSRMLATAWGSKIGGIPSDEVRKLPGRFLCSLSSVQVVPDVPYPWTNERTPIGLDDIHEPKYSVCWADMHAFYFFIDERGIVRHTLGDG